MQARMWHAKLRAGDFLGIVEQQVKIQRAWAVVDVTAAAEGLFDGLQGLEQIVWWQGSGEDGGGVDEIRLRGQADRCGTVERGAAQQRARW